MPKAFANFSPRLERSDNLGIKSIKKKLTLKGLGMCAANPFRVERFFFWRGSQGFRCAQTLG
jgi:hypothetical protein